MNVRIATVVLGLCILGGCSSDGRLDTAGDHPTLGNREPMTPEAREAEVDTGRILVFAPNIADATSGDAGAPPRAVHSGYTVYTEDGRKVAHETNQAGFPAQGPVELKLAPGRYFVRLDEPTQGPRTFWVTVERAKVTRVGNKAGSDTPATVRQPKAGP